MRVLRVCHAGRDATHRERERALVRAGASVTLVVPSSWPGPEDLPDEPFEIVEFPVRRPGDVNRHAYRDPEAIARLVARLRPDVLDLHEEPFSSVTRQLLRRIAPTLPVVGYTAQNVDKRFPPPFAQWERAALGRLDGLYPCSAQAASVAVGKGFRGPVRVLPLPPAAAFRAGRQRPPGNAPALLLVGRLVAEKGVTDAVRVLAELRRDMAATLEIVGDGPAATEAAALAGRLGVAEAVIIRPALAAGALARRYARAQVLLVPSRATARWVEQFGRVVPEAHAAGAVVVAYASGALPEVVGAAGVLVPEGDVAAMAGAVRRLSAEPAEWRRLRDLGLAAARACTWDAVAAGQLSLYQESIRASAASRPGGGRRRPPGSQRAAAVRRYGQTARLDGVARPFALPVLRGDTTVARLSVRVAERTDRADRVPATLPDRGRRLRVVYLDHTATLSGAELALSRTIPALPDVEAHVILGRDGPLRAALEAAGAQVEVLALHRTSRTLRRADVGAGTGQLAAAAHTAAYALRLARRLRQLRPDLVHTNSLKAGYYGSLAARLAGVPVVWQLHDRLAADYLPPAAIGLTRALLRSVPAALVCNSQATRATAGARARRGYVIGCPVTVPAGPTATRSGKDPVVGMVGRIATWKGQDVFLRALAQVSRELPRVRGRVVGAPLFDEADVERDLHALAAELGIDARVSFAGHVEDVAAELAGMDVLVHASVLPEPFGQVILEGMAAGVPVIASGAGGAAEIVSDGVTGILTPPGDAAALAAAILRVLADPRLGARLAAAGRERARDFAPEVVGAQLRQVYDDVLGRRGR